MYDTSLFASIDHDITFPCMIVGLFMDYLVRKIGQVEEEEVIVVICCGYCLVEIERGESRDGEMEGERIDKGI